MSISLQKVHHKILTFIALAFILFALESKAESDEKNNENDQWWSSFFSAKFFRGFTASLTAILVSEIGDKTFFIAAIMSMKYSRLTVFGGAILSLILMTILSAAFGLVFLKFIPPVITRWVSVGLFAVFGLKMLYEGWKMSPADVNEEMNDVQNDLSRRENARSQGSCDVEEATEEKKVPSENWKFILQIFMQAFTMTFVAEWGDRSQITTIVLAASENIYAVILGGVLGHSICTGLAVIGGRLIASKISVRTVTIIGGIVFLAFAIMSSIWDPTKEAQELNDEGKTLYMKEKLIKFGLI